MTDDLVNRLLNAPADGLGTENLCLEAADRIEGLTENQRFIIRERDRTFALMLARAEKAEADNARLREAAKDVDWLLSGDKAYECSGLSRRLRAALNTGKEVSQ